MVKTPKVSPLGYRGVRARRVPPGRCLLESHPGGVPEQRGMPNDNTLIDISISAGSREQAIKFCNVWHNNAPKLYDEIIKLFAKKEK